MTLFDALLLGTLEGLTEFLPISSTGHLILASSVLSIPSSAFHTSFMIAIQLGAILAVVVMFYKKFLNLRMIRLLIIAFIPTGVLGYLLYSSIKGLLQNPLIVAYALIIGGIVLILLELWNARRNNEPVPLTPLRCMLIGVGQALAMIPGVSRSGATVATGLSLGISREHILQFSFLLAVPTMLMATAYDLYKNPIDIASGDLVLLLVGFGIAFAVALSTMKAALWFVRNHSFIIFGVYRIILGGVFLLFTL
jgi:undecaprenyl-diphosphatase